MPSILRDLGTSRRSRRMRLRARHRWPRHRPPLLRPKSLRARAHSSLRVGRVQIIRVLPTNSDAIAGFRTSALDAPKPAPRLPGRFAFSCLSRVRGAIAGPEQSASIGHRRALPDRAHPSPTSAAPSPVSRLPRARFLPGPRPRAAPALRRSIRPRRNPPATAEVPPEPNKPKPPWN